MTVSDAGTPLATVPTIWGNVPQRNKNFTGRTDILTLLKQSAPSKVTAVLPEDPLPQALQGLGGVGKTAVAIEYAYRHRSAYDLVWWIPADQLPLVRASLAALAGRLGLESAMATGIDSAAAAALDALRRGDPFRRWLLIFDNADQPEEILDLIPRGPGDVLITSRNHRWQSVIDTVSMDVFVRAESAEFLIKRVPKGLSEADADRLAEKLGDLPLALEQAGAMLAETGMPVDEYLRLLNEQVTNIMAEGKSPDYPMSMTAAWKLSVSTLEQQLPQARELLRCCAFFGSEAIPTDVFRRGTQAAQASVASVMSDPILLARAIRELGRFALVTIDGRSVTVHRLIQALLRDELTAEQQADYRHQVHLILAAAAPKNPADDRQWSQYRQLLPHLASDSTELALSTEPAVREFALNMMRYLHVSGDLTSCLSLAERFIGQWTKDSGPDDPAVLAAQRHMGNALRLLGRYPECLELTEAALGRARATLGERDALTLTLRTAFGADLRARGDFLAARALDEETRTELEEAHGPTDQRTLRLLASLALDYGLSSDYRGARDLYQRVFGLMNAASTDLPGIELLGTWTGLAWAVRLCGNFREARDVSEDAWDFGRERLGPEHIATLRSASGVSSASRRIPEEREAGLRIAAEIYELCSRLFGEGHPDTLAIAISLTNLLRTTGNLDDALAMAERTANLYPGVYGPEHPYHYGCLGNLALLRRVTGDPSKARQLNERALVGLDARLTRDHHYSLTVAVNLASDLAVLGLSTEARELGEDTLRRHRALMGDDHPATLGCAANLSLDLRATGAVEAGDELAASTMERYLATLGADNPDAEVAAAGERLDFDFDPPPI
jgi:tetratricopeptide (TPR) repeat protein